MQYKKLIVGAGAAIAGFAAPLIAWAQTNPFERAGKTINGIQTEATGGTSTDLMTIVGRIINIALGFLGIILLGYLLLAGFYWMTAGGESKTVDKAKDMIKNAIIGLIIIVAAFAISNFVLTSLVNVAR